MLELQVSSEDFIRVANASVQHGKSRASTNMSLVMTIWVVALRTVGNAVSNTPSSPILALLHLVHSLSKIEKRFSIELTGYKRHMSRSGLSSSALYSRKTWEEFCGQASAENAQAGKPSTTGICK